MSISDNFNVKSVTSAAPAKAPPPFSLRLSAKERAALETAAAGIPLGTFIREKLFGEELVPRRTRNRTPVADHAALAKVLAALGASRLSNNLNQIAKAANLGTLPVSPEVEDDLQTACVQIREMRDLLLRGLGVGQGGAS